METYKEMIMDELRQTQKEKEALQQVGVDTISFLLNISFYIYRINFANVCTLSFKH